MCSGTLEREEKYEWIWTDLWNEDKHTCRKEVSKLWQANACPWCGRDVFRYQNINGIRYEQCFRCGYRAKLGNMIEVQHSTSDDCCGQAREANLVNKYNRRRCSNDYGTLGTIPGNDELEECYGQAV